MKQIHLLTLGKIREEWIKNEIQEYQKRLSGRVEITITLCKNDEQLLKKAESIKTVYCLDALGKLLTSEAFAHQISSDLERGSSEIAFIIGGPDGLSSRLKKQFPKLSLSPMTFTSQISTLLLIEQLYRAFEIQKGSSYHK